MRDVVNQEVVSVTRLRLKFPGEPSLTFKDLSLSVPQGQKVLMLGPSGCGKSTLLQVLCGLVPQSIELPMQADSISLPVSWGIVFQDPDTQFGMPYADEELAFVLENMNVPRENMIPRMERVLEQVGLRLPVLHTLIHTLSQGMKQRLALAAVLLMEPDVLFLDEPSALLDPEGTEQIWKAIKDNAADKTVIIVEHKIDAIVDFADRVILFDDQGKVSADGPPKVIFQQEKERLISYGIWYPGVWDDYAASLAYKKLVQARTLKHRDERASEPNEHHLVQLESFSGLRDREVRISVPHARIETGDWIVLMGENGAGKSTLLLSVMQLLRTEGIFLWNGAAIPARSKPLADRIAFVFQNPELQFVMNTIEKELSLSLGASYGGALTEAEQASVEAMLEDLNLSMDPHRHPYQLSVGQKRRLSVATALMNEKPLILLDEPTFGQDARNTFMILEMLERFRQQGAAVLMATHDEQIAAYFATQLWIVEDGRLASCSKVQRKAVPSAEVLR